MANYKVPVFEQFEWQAPVEDKDLTEAPDAPSKGDRYIVASPVPSGDDWDNHENDIAYYDGASWQFITVKEGMITYVKDENTLYLYTTSWAQFIGNGDMLKSTYDTDTDGIVDEAEAINDGTNSATASEIVKSFYNILLNAFRIAVNGSLVKFNMIDGIMDEFEDESGVDTGTSENEDYDSVNDLYSPSVIELDYMEYADNATAQSNYVSSDSTSKTIDSYSEANKDTADGIGAGVAQTFLGQALTLASAETITSVKFYVYKEGSPTGNVVARLYTVQGTVGTNAYPTGSVLAESDAVDISTWGAGAGAIGLVEFTFSTPYEASAGDYVVGLYYTDGDGSNYGVLGVDNSSPSHSGNGCNDSGSKSYDVCFYLYGAIPLQCYSESTIKQQGSYSLEVVAQETDSLNDTLTKSGLSIDLSGMNTVIVYIYSSRTGSNIKVGLHDSGGTTTESTPNVTSSGTWQRVEIDISGVADADKDDIDSIIITIVNADAINTFYIDNMFAIGNMTLVSNATEAETQPDNCRIVIMEEDVDAVTINTDLKVYASRDNGANWVQATLSDEGDYASGKRILVGNADVSGQASDKTMKWKITTLNNKDCNLHAIGLLWD